MQRSQSLDEEEEENIHAMPFGDTYLQRANYETGFMYAGRRRFLNDEDDNNLRPPHEFMTRLQSLKFVHMQSGDNLERLQEMALLNEQKMAEQNVKIQTKRKNVIKKKAIQKTIVLEKFSSTSPEDWGEEFIAGCRMWTNHNTGEVSDVCPFEDDEGEEESSPMKSGTSASDEVEEGTGAPVYDGSELQGLFDYLDAHPSPANSPTKSKA